MTYNEEVVPHTLEFPGVFKGRLGLHDWSEDCDEKWWAEI